ncbi:helix-turn-helix transcriptional regulator [Luteipulveratus sp. YIM 133132]|uniref:helix-turn-helix domain-containing protein n=1 Tax=Luteipulveratus flavus TaxID=3031728 RepID=UPI0023B03C87|nr:helix-turn-helix transcriptional regulator [Luteipulveratus sp. YIM 133132]MDE9367499.1 helix-turn-helix transcriptional regulator [Luteipulveratus sp. YIM 133132]
MSRRQQSIATVTALPPVREAAPAPLLRDVFGRLLREARLRQGRTLADVSGEAGVSMPYLSEIERGLKEPSSEVLGALCGALGATVADLVAGAHRELSAVSAPPVVHELRTQRSAAPVRTPDAMLLAA